MKKKVPLLNEKTITLIPSDDPFTFENDTTLSMFLKPYDMDEYLDSRNAAKEYTKQNNRIDNKCVFVHTNTTLHFDTYPIYITYINKHTKNTLPLYTHGSIKNLSELTNKTFPITFEVTPFIKEHVENDITKCYLHFDCKNILVNYLQY